MLIPLLTIIFMYHKKWIDIFSGQLPKDNQKSQNIFFFSISIFLATIANTSMLNLHCNHETHCILNVPVLTSPNCLVCHFHLSISALALCPSTLQCTKKSVSCHDLLSSPIQGPSDRMRSVYVQEWKVAALCWWSQFSPPLAQSDHSFSSGSESSSDSLYSTAMRRDRMVATSLPTGSFLASCSLCSWTLRSWIPRGEVNSQ